MTSHHDLQQRATTRVVAAAATKTTARPNPPAQTVVTVQKTRPATQPLSTGAIIGIVVAIIVIIILIVAFVWWKRRRAQRDEAQDQPDQWQQQQQQHKQSYQYHQQKDLQGDDGAYIGSGEQYENFRNSDRAPFFGQPSRPAMGGGVPYADRDMEMVNR